MQKASKSAALKHLIESDPSCPRDSSSFGLRIILLLTARTASYVSLGFLKFLPFLEILEFLHSFYDSNLKSLRRQEVSIPHIMPIQASGSCIAPSGITTSSREPHRLLVQRSVFFAPVCFIAAQCCSRAGPHPYKPLQTHLARVKNGGTKISCGNQEG